jgi:multicomponent Na+:H+ antiporter subunit F
VIVAVAYAGLFAAAVCALYRLLVGPTLADRIISLDLVLICLMVGITVDAVDRDDTTWLNVLVVIAIVGFTATVATTRFMERHALRRGPR